MSLLVYQVLGLFYRIDLDDSVCVWKRGQRDYCTAHGHDHIGSLEGQQDSGVLAVERCSKQLIALRYRKCSAVLVRTDQRALACGANGCKDVLLG